MLVALPGDLGVRNLFERQHLGIEIHGAIHVGDGDSDRVHAVNQSGFCWARACWVKSCGTARTSDNTQIANTSLVRGDLVERVASCLDYLLTASSRSCCRLLFVRRLGHSHAFHQVVAHS